MIHEFREEFLSLPLEQYILTFDDGLYSQYYYWPKLREIPTEKIFFISSGIVCRQEQSLEFPACNVAHQKAFAGNKEDYMTCDQIKDLMRHPKVTIGGHSHSHIRLSTFNTLLGKVNYIKTDTEEMLNWFRENLGFRPTSFCFPYNEDFDKFYSGLLRNYGFTEFYGRGRIPIETLLHN